MNQNGTCEWLKKFVLLQMVLDMSDEDVQSLVDSYKELAQNSNEEIRQVCIFITTSNMGTILFCIRGTYQHACHCIPSEWNKENLFQRKSYKLTWERGERVSPHLCMPLLLQAEPREAIWVSSSVMCPEAKRWKLIGSSWFTYSRKILPGFAFDNIIDKTTPLLQALSTS